jgi:hypothetical protein
MTRKVLSLLVAALLVLSAAAASAPAKHGDDNGTKLEGRVLSVNRTAHTFRLKDPQLGTLRIAWNRTTTFDGIRSSQVRPGKILEVHFRLSNGRRLAIKVQQGGGHN